VVIYVLNKLLVSAPIKICDHRKQTEQREINVWQHEKGINSIKLKVVGDVVNILNVTQAMGKVLCALQSKAIRN